MDLTAVFFQYVLPAIVVGVFGALTAWGANRATQKQKDIEYWRDSAKDLRGEFDKLKTELVEVKSLNVRYEMAFTYVRNEPSSNPVMIRTAQAIIDGKFIPT